MAQGNEAGNMILNEMIDIFETKEYLKDLNLQSLSDIGSLKRNFLLFEHNVISKDTKYKLVLNNAEHNNDEDLF